MSLICFKDRLPRTAGTISGISMNIFTVLGGYILDRYGIFWSRSLSTIQLTVGLLLLMFAKENNSLLFIGIIIYSGGTFSLLVNNYTLAGLFPTLSGFIMVGGQVIFLASGSWFRFWAFLDEMGISFRWIIAINILLTIILWIR